MSDVSAAATRYVRLVDEARRLRRERNALLCAHMPPRIDEEGMPPALHPDGEQWQEVACWTTYRERVDMGVEEYPFGDGSARGWCESCERRQRLHAELLAATRARSGALLTLRAAVRREVPNV
jgi:hypothetical protein